MTFTIAWLCVALLPGSAPDRPVPSVDLPFAPARLTVSADGATAAVWNAVRKPTDPQRLAVVDLQRLELVAQTTLPYPLLDVVVGQDVYIADKTGIRRLSTARLEPQAEFKTGGRPAQLMLVADRLLSTGPRLRLALPDLQPIEDYDHDIRTADGWLDGRSGFGWFSEGVLWDDAMEKPLLLVWPYEFRRNPWQNALRHSPREPSPFQPSTDVWHPFSTQLNKKPEDAVLASATSPDIAATLAVVKDPDGYGLASFRLESGKRIAHIPLAPDDTQSASTSRPAFRIATGGERFAVLQSNRLYVGSLKKLRGEDPPPFHIVPRQSTFVLATDRPTTVRYEAVGATRFCLSSRALGHDGKSFEATSDTGEFTLRIAPSIDGLLKQTAGLAANLPRGRDLTDNRQRAEFYAGPSRAAFFRLFGREPTGVPLPIDVQVIAEGTDFESAVLRHDFLVELPLDRLEEALDRMYPTSRYPWKQPKHAFNLTDYPAIASPPTDKGPLFDYLRGLWATPHPAVSGQELRQAALLAKQSGDRRLRERCLQWIADNQWRTWTDAEGRTSEALLVQYFAGQVTLQTRKGTEFTFDEAKLGQADRDFLRNMEQPSTPSDSDAWRELVFTESLQAVKRFHDVHNVLPPRALTDDAGQPRLSWRVLLLREMGYGELFSLFRFDEPWNSDHNRSLIAAMPDCLAIDIPLATAGKTTLMTICSSLSAMRTDGPSTMRNFGREGSSTVVFVEAVSSRAAQWTKPVDLALYEFADPLSVAHARNDRVLVGLLDGAVLEIPADTSPDDWRFAINRGDRRRLFERDQP